MPLAIYTLKAFDRWCPKSIADATLVRHAHEVEAGQYRAALGSMLYKKDMGPKNGLRAFVYCRPGSRAAYMKGIAKADEANVSEDVLNILRALAKSFDAATPAQVAALLQKGTYRELP